MTRSIRLLACLMAIAVIPKAAAQAAPPFAPDPSPSVLVTTMMPRSGTSPDLIEAYGSAVAAFDGTRTVSVLQDGRVLRVLHGPGEAVHAGDRLLDWEASAAATQAWEQAQSASTLARQQQAHASMLLASHLATRDQVDAVGKAAIDAQGTLDALRREGGDHPVRSIVAPFDGFVTSVAAAQGDRVAAGAPLLVLCRSDGLVATVGVDPTRLGSLHPGAPVTLQPLAGGASFAGVVMRVDSAVDPRTRLVDIDISAPAGSLLPGAELRAVITTGTLHGWLVPHAAVLEDGDGTFLFQVAGGKAVRVPVRVVGNSQDTDIVDGALTPARPVVLDGSAQLTDGTLVRTAAGL